MTEPISIYVCFEPQRQAYAERLDTWPWTNQDLDAYNRRIEFGVDSPQAEPIKLRLRERIEQADVTVCLIATSTSSDPWIAWELEVSKSGPNPNGLVGVTLQKFDEHPPAMVDCGAIFVEFKRDLVERAVRWALTERHASDDFTLRDF